MFFRRADFLAAGGCDTRLPIMEDVDLSVRLSRFGGTRMMNRVETGEYHRSCLEVVRSNRSSRR